MRTLVFSLIITLTIVSGNIFAQYPDAVKWSKYEIKFTSSREYSNPVQDVRVFEISFTSPSGIKKTINGFWDGANDWKARFMPFEEGEWSFETVCSDASNKGLHGIKGVFKCGKEAGTHDIFIHGPVIRPAGTYHLAHSDGTPFFWLACTAWNGALRSTAEEWELYLTNRVENGYSAIQLITTQWRGCEKSSEGKVAFEGSGKISINPDFFDLIDAKIDQVNQKGLVAAPAILWTLQTGSGRELSPGYYLPDDQAIILAKYIVARYGGNHVVWFLGGDGNYTGTYEQRWKTIGRAVFNGKHQGIVAQHPQGRSWIGEVYKDEPWLDIIGYQSSHSNAEGTVNWINKGPMSKLWSVLPARPLINLEPNYEEIRTTINARDVRNASYWSLFATPVSGVTYGHNGIWPWLREGEKILNHSDAPWTSTWDKGIKLPGSVQMGYLKQFITKFAWWDLYPAPELLVKQPGDSVFNHFVSVMKMLNNKTIIGYMPVRQEIELRKPASFDYRLRWFDPVTNKYSSGSLKDGKLVVGIQNNSDQDMIFILEAVPSAPVPARRNSRDIM